jgi:MarR family 2-MHQ and catechol resistance regulon transcriptional repressor
MKTPYRGSPRERRALDAFIKIRRATNAIQARLAPSYARDSLTESQFGTLEVLYHLGPLCQRDIARKILKSGGNLTLVIDNLEKAGLVRRRTSSEDRREKLVELTAKGADLIERIFPPHAGDVADLFSGLTVAEQGELARLCRKLGLSLAPD